MGRRAGWMAALVIAALATVSVGGPAHAATADTVPAGGSYAASGGGFAPGSTGAINLLSAPVRLGSFTADDAGEVHVDVTIPADTEPGEHRLELAGSTPSGAPLSVLLPITVVAATASAPTTAPAVPLPDAMANTGSGNGFLALAAVALLLLGASYLGVGHSMARPLAAAAAPVARARLRLRTPAPPPPPIRLRRRR